jgi:hypothetical protein
LDLKNREETDVDDLVRGRAALDDVYVTFATEVAEDSDVKLEYGEEIPSPA